MYITTHEELLKLHGKRVTCEIDGEYIDDAKIVVEADRIYVCQNKRLGSSPKNKVGYEKGWCISILSRGYEIDNYGVTKIQLKEQFKRGDMIMVGMNEHKAKRIYLTTIVRLFL